MQTVVQESTVSTPAVNVARGGKYLIFQLGKEEFGIGVLKVREIMGIQDITPVPHTPKYVKGVINLRGKVIPVVDLRLKFDLEEKGYTQRTCIIVVQLVSGAESMPMGIVVDGVAEVLNIGEADIETPPAFGADLDTSYLLGIAKFKGQVKMLLDIDKAINAAELTLFKQ